VRLSERYPSRFFPLLRMQRPLLDRTAQMARSRPGAYARNAGSSQACDHLSGGSPDPGSHRSFGPLDLLSN
jgi:hypothetical protein